jgi:ribonuclease E
MSKVMLINVTHAEESRVGIVADGKLVSFEIESFSREHLKGNIYKATIHRIHPALEAAFVDIGADRDAFLPLDEICFRHLASQPRNGGNNGERRRPRIQDILKPGEEILVQIVKEQFGSKPPTLSTFYSLPGRYLVLLPGSDDAGISRRIEGADRVRIRELIEKLSPPEGFGIIVRTVAGFDPGVHDLQRDLTYLLRLWESIQQAAVTKRAPALVYREHDLVLRNIRDYFTPDIDEIHVDNEDVFQRAREFLRDVMPEKEGALRLYHGDKPIFSHFNVEQQIESIYKRRVPLKSGGSIVIDGTEALTAIDVNSGRSVRGGSQEETAFKTNAEAAVEIGRQLRLRDLGGLIVIDFIDMRNPQHISEVEKALRVAMHEDKARHEVGRISHFGLLEVSRQRLRPAAAATSYVACTMCDGHGLVRTTESAALVVLRKIHNRVAQGDAAYLKVSLPSEVAIYLLNQKREDLAQLERRYVTRIQVVPSTELMPHQSEIEVRPRVEGGPSEQPLIRLGGVAVSAPSPAVEVESATIVGTDAAADDIAAGSPEAASAGASNGAGTADKPPAKRRRRRGRRRGRGKQAAAAIGDALTALAAGTSLSTSSEPKPSIETTATSSEVSLESDDKISRHDRHPGKAVGYASDEVADLATSEPIDSGADSMESSSPEPGSQPELAAAGKSGDPSKRRRQRGRPASRRGNAQSPSQPAVKRTKSAASKTAKTEPRAKKTPERARTKTASSEASKQRPRRKPAAARTPQPTQA